MASSSSQPLYAAIDMGTSSFKLLIARPHPHGGFVPLLRRKNAVVLVRRHGDVVSDESQTLAIEALRSFQSVLRAQNVAISHTRCVATSAIREAANRTEFLNRIRNRTGIDVEVLSGEEEARLVYLSAVQFFPILSRAVLCVDIGGGSTEFVVGQRGNVSLASSLKLGHVTLTERFKNQSNNGVEEMREHIRWNLRKSGVIESVKKLGFEVAVGTSGMARALEKAAFGDSLENLSRDWKLRRIELKRVVERLSGKEEDEVRVRAFGRRSEFIVAGAVLMDEIFEELDLEEMEISGFALVEGVIGEAMRSSGEFSGELGSNSRLSSVVRLATRLCGNKKMEDSANCAIIAKEIFDGSSVSLNDKDLEHIEAACLLHNVGLSGGKKGYHKQSYRIIMTGDHLQGFSSGEIKLIALLVRYHRKKLPEPDHSLFDEFPESVKNFEVLCAIVRVSVTLRKYQSRNLEETETLQSHESFNFKSVLRDLENQNSPAKTALLESENDKEELRRELKYFKKVFHQDLSEIVSSRASD